LERDLESQRQQKEQALLEIKQKNRTIIDFEIEVDELGKAKRYRYKSVKEKRNNWLRNWSRRLIRLLSS
jgi:hypothetical protein